MKQAMANKWLAINKAGGAPTIQRKVRDGIERGLCTEGTGPAFYLLGRGGDNRVRGWVVIECNHDGECVQMLSTRQGCQMSWSTSQAPLIVICNASVVPFQYYAGMWQITRHITPFPHPSHLWC